MTSPWPALWTVLALSVLLVLIIRGKVQAFVALLVVSLGLGLAAGLPPEQVAQTIGKGVGSILADVAIILALGAMLGRMLDVSGAAEVIARTLVRAFGVARASAAILVAGYITGIPVLFNVGFLLLIPIMWRLQRDTGRSLLYFALPLSFSLGIAHSFIPPHPGIVGAVNAFAGNKGGTLMVETIVFGTLLGVPIVAFGWFGPGRFWAKRQHVGVPEHLAPPDEAPMKEGAEPADKPAPPSFGVALSIVTLPLVLSLLGFGAKLLGDLGQLPSWMTQAPAARSELPEAFAIAAHPPVDWLRFLGHPTMALLLPTGLAFWLLGARRGLGRNELAKIAGDALNDVGAMAFLFGAAGGFKQVIQDTGAGEYIAVQVRQLPLSAVTVAYLVAVLMRVALGSATAAILTASALLAALARDLPGREVLLVLAVANGVTFATQPADSGFWLVKEYCNLSVRDVLVRFNACRILMSLLGLALLLACESLLF
ncbi:MAG: GntP family permease [Gemmataceae bacterium]|nr:GntP family permease [Gemmataceae bacterium]